MTYTLRLRGLKKMKDKKFHIGNGKPKQRLFFNNINKNKYIKLQKKTKHYKKN